MINTNKPIFSVNQINKYVKAVLTNDESLKYIYIKGEISNAKVAMNGHLYFSLKDSESMISAVMFSNYSKSLTFTPKDGDEVIVLASIDVYAPRGTYQLFIYEMNLKGQGDLLLELEKLKKKLQGEGLFEESRKRPINIYPKAIGIITAKNSAASKDLLINIKRRYPIADIYFFPANVQGENAPKSLLNAFKLSQEYDLDTLIIGRGGGASEDLSAFNDETLVRAIATSKFPVISAVGHEVDSTLVDYVADKRASTPTGAAELATVDQREIIQNVSYLLDNMKNSLKNYIDNMKKDYQNEIENLTYYFKNKLEKSKSEFTNSKNRLLALNPKGILSRGYSLTTNKDKKVITNSDEVSVGEEIYTVLNEGTLTSVVKEK